MRKKKTVPSPQIFCWLIGILLRNASKYMLISVAMCALVGLATAANTPIKQYFFEAVEYLVDNQKIGLVIGLGTFWGIFTLLTLLIQGMSDLMIEDLGVRLGGFLGKKVNQKAANLTPVCYEDNSLLNSINQAYKGVEQSAIVIQIFITLVWFYGPYFIFFSIYMYHIQPTLCIGLLLVLLPTLGGQYLRTFYYTKMENQVAPIRREMEYYQSCIVDREYGKETRLLGAVFFFREIYEATIILFQKKTWKTERKTGLVELGLRLLSLLVYVVILSLLYFYLKMGYMGTATFAAILTSIDQMFNYMDYVGYRLGDISSYIPAVRNTLLFMDLPERSGNNVKLKHGNIEFHHVTFRYPNNKRPVLNDVNLSILEGETIAVVGENGAGKSTFAKLLLGLYLPGEGEVLVGGWNTKEISTDVLFRKSSAVFQDFQRYKMTLRKNIEISEGAYNQEDSRLKKVMREINLEEKSDTLSEGINTMLSKEFGGTDFSGGQWQRIAIGRGLYRNSEMIVLDEPTASIDPLEESRIYHQFAKLSKGKTSIIITHRIGSARLADRIVVMSNGAISGIGTHSDLLKCNAVYRRMYEAQAKWYQ